jgi:hypothetical protein
MRANTLVIGSLLLLLALPCQARGGGGGGHGGGGHCGGSGHSGFGGSSTGGSHATGSGSGSGSYNPYNPFRRHGWIGGYYPGNNNVEDAEPYEPVGPSAAGGNVDPSLTRDDFVKSYSWPRR